jgi:diaminopimelate decarboxylase
LVAQTDVLGVLLTKVLFTKTTGSTDFVILDAGMTKLIRPALYQAKHKIVAVVNSSHEQKSYNVVEPKIK